MKYCPCGTDKSYTDCCGMFIAGEKLPITAEELMRSRYSAYHQRHFEYIINTMKPPAADAFNLDDAKKSADGMRWTRLEIIKSTNNTVEFRAHYRVGNEHFFIHENSQFERENGKWFYVDGVHETE